MLNQQNNGRKKCSANTKENAKVCKDDHERDSGMTWNEWELLKIDTNIIETCYKTGINIDMDVHIVCKYVNLKISNCCETLKEPRQSVANLCKMHGLLFLRLITSSLQKLETNHDCQNKLILMLWTFIIKHRITSNCTRILYIANINFKHFFFEILSLKGNP